MNEFQQRRNANKTNANQKKIMVDFMLQHPELARNTLLSGNNGKKIAQRLWATLSAKLNAAGPPVKDVKTWRKVYSDQKHSMKKKISMQKLRTPNVHLRNVEQQIVRAAGLDNDTEDENSMPAMDPYAAMHSNMQPEDANSNDYYHRPRFDIIEIKEELEDNNHDPNEDEAYNNANGHDYNQDYAMYNHMDLERSNLQNMTANLNERFQDYADFHRLISVKLDRLIKMNQDLINMKERSLKMKEEQHAMDMAMKRIDLQKKSLELQLLKAKPFVNACI